MPLGLDSVMVTLPSPGVTPAIPASRAAYREFSPRAVFSTSAAIFPVRGVPSEKAAFFRKMVQVSLSSLTAAPEARTGWGSKLPSSR